MANTRERDPRTGYVKLTGEDGAVTLISPKEDAGNTSAFGSNKFAGPYPYAGKEGKIMGNYARSRAKANNRSQYYKGD